MKDKEYKEFKLFFDTETTAANPAVAELVQLAAILDDPYGNTVQTLNCIVQPYYEGEIPEGATRIHGIHRVEAEKYGMPLDYVLGRFADLTLSTFHDMGAGVSLIAHNLKYDKTVMERLLIKSLRNLYTAAEYCTMQNSTQLCKLPFPSGRSGYKWPTLQELHKFLFGKEFEGAHDAMADVSAARGCYYELVKREKAKKV